jgi:hypothetical protein
MTTARDDLAKAEAILVAAIKVNVPELVVARTAIGNFQSKTRSTNGLKLQRTVWWARLRAAAQETLAAVRNAIISQ